MGACSSRDFDRNEDDDIKEIRQQNKKLAAYG